MNKIIFAIIIFISLSKTSFASNDYKIATIRFLDKITAKSTLIDIELNKNFIYRGLDIKVHKCWNAPLERKPETKMLLEISETKNEDTQKLFFGWLFASSPSISSIEHPIYDITAIKCK